MYTVLLVLMLLWRTVNCAHIWSGTTGIQYLRVESIIHLIIGWNPQRRGGGGGEREEGGRGRRGGEGFTYIF